jgi:2',3'-cyclic-nucleotide 2'-phosphodiesterase (5'-nucleotidase family)
MRKTSISRSAPEKWAFLFSLLLWLSPSSAVAQDKTGAAKPTATPSTTAKAIQQNGSVPSAPANAGKSLVDDTIPEDPALRDLLKPYSAKVHELDVVIGKLAGELRKGGLGAGSLGNFVTDGMRAVATSKLSQSVDVAITNSGGLRKNSFAPGELRVVDIFELLPFENQLVTVELTGEQLLKAFQVIAAGREAQSGGRLRYLMNQQRKPELVSVTLVGDRQIDPAATYRVVTVDYLLNVSGGNMAILAQGKNIKPLGITIRDALIEYVKAETAAGRVIKSNLDGRFSSR